MSYRLIRIDELTLKDHFYLEDADSCFYLMEFTKGKKSNFSSTNQLIFNLKKSLDRKGAPDWHYKRQAIVEVARILKQLFDPNEIPTLTFVPIPPHTQKDDPAYDDRMVQVLKKMCEGLDADIRELLSMSETMEPSHYTKGKRPSPDELSEFLIIDEGICDPTPGKIIIFDDVLTAGAHFKACQQILQDKFPRARIAGLFVARRVIAEEEL